MINKFFNIITNFQKKKYDLYTKKKLIIFLPDLQNHILINKSCGANFQIIMNYIIILLKKNPNIFWSVAQVSLLMLLLKHYIIIL